MANEQRPEVVILNPNDNPSSPVQSAEWTMQPNPAAAQTVQLTLLPAVLALGFVLLVAAFLCLLHGLLPETPDHDEQRTGEETV